MHKVKTIRHKHISYKISVRLSREFINYYNMVFTFWQNVISIHQIPFLKALSTKHNVTLCVEKSIENVRAEEGWKIPDLGDIRIYVAPNDVKTKSLLNASSIHVFSGISTYPMVYDAFKKAVAKGFRILSLIHI